MAKQRKPTPAITDPSVQEGIAAIYARDEPHRLACEARWVCSLPLLAHRRAYLENVEIKRGKEACDILRREVTVEWARIGKMAAKGAD